MMKDFVKKVKQQEVKRQEVKQEEANLRILRVLQGLSPQT